MLQIPFKSMVGAAVLCASNAALAQTYIEPAPATPAVVAPAPMPTEAAVPPAAAATAPVGDVVVGTPEVTLQLHPITHFGAAKQIFVHGASDMSIYGRHAESPKALGPVSKADQFLISAELKTGYFFTDMFAAGLTGVVAATNNLVAQSVGMHVGPFVAMNMPLRHHFSFFPSLSGTYGYSNQIGKSAGQSIFAHDIELELQLTVLFHVTEHYSISVSPFANQVLYARGGVGFDHDVQSQQGDWVTTYGGKIGLLFWR